MYHGLIVEDTYSTPAIGDTIAVSGVKLFCRLQIIRINVGDIRDLVVVQRFQKIVFDHFLDHIIGWTDDVIDDCSGLYLRVHNLIGLKFIVNNGDAGFFLKLIQNIRINVFSPVVDDQRVGIGGSCRVFFFTAGNRKNGEQECGSQYN